MTDDKMREAFEAHVSPEFPRWDKDRLYMRQEDGNYWNWQVQGYWRMWQAAAAQQAQEIEALRAKVQDQALHLISAHAQAEEAHADAELYRYLRAQHEGEHAQALCVFCPGVVNGLDPVGSMPGELDAAIRAAMKDSHDRP